MEVKDASLLYTLATLMITFAGFSSLLLALRPAAGAKLSRLDRYIAKTVITYVCVDGRCADAGSACALRRSRRMDLAHLRRAVRSADAVAAGVLSLPTPQGGRQRAAGGDLGDLLVLGSLVTLTMLGCIVLGLQYSAAVYITALTIDFFTVIYGYLAALDIVMQQPIEASDHPAPR